MEVVEQFVLGKMADPGLCEDAVVVTEEYAAVVDGATDISDKLYDGMAGGRWAMAACVDAVRGFAAGLDAPTAVAVLTEEVAGRICPETPPADRPSASVTIYSAAHRQVWQVGTLVSRMPDYRRALGNHVSVSMRSRRRFEPRSSPLRLPPETSPWPAGSEYGPARTHLPLVERGGRSHRMLQAAAVQVPDSAYESSEDDLSGGSVRGGRVAGGHPTEAALTVRASRIVLVVPPCVMPVRARRQAARQQITDLLEGHSHF